MKNSENYPFYSPELSRSQDVYSQEDKELAIHFLTAIEEDQGLIESGNVTFAMIRPSVGPDANLLGLGDAEAADTIEEMISELGVMGKFSFTFNQSAIAELYAGDPQENMLKQTPVNPDKYSSRWPEFIDFMSSGPTTALILFSANGDAIEKWRSHLGHWNVDVNRDSSTIRGRLAVDKYNNLVHGSDSPAAVRREIGIIKSILLWSDHARP